MLASPSRLLRSAVALAFASTSSSSFSSRSSTAKVRRRSSRRDNHFVRRNPHLQRSRQPFILPTDFSYRYSRTLSGRSRAVSGGGLLRLVSYALSRPTVRVILGLTLASPVDSLHSMAYAPSGLRSPLKRGTQCLCEGSSGPSAPSPTRKLACKPTKKRYLSDIE